MIVDRMNRRSFTDADKLGIVSSRASARQRFAGATALGFDTDGEQTTIGVSAIGAELPMP